MNRRTFLASTGAALAVAALPAFTSAAAEADSFDVVVYGGVPCGIAAAIAAAREGASVLLIEPTKHVGGLNTSGLNTAETEHMLKWTFGGIAREVYERIGRHYAKWEPAYYFESHVAEKVFNDMLAEAKVPVRFGVRVEKVEKDGARIRSITLSNGSVIAAKIFVDAGYEGDVMARAGVSYTWGRESRAEFGEEKAGISFDPPRKAATVDEAGKLLPGISGWARDFHEGDGDKCVMNYNWRLTFSNDPATRVPIPPPKHYDRSRFRLLENWLREMAADGKDVKLTDILDLYTHAPGRKDKKEVNNKQAAIISIGHFGGQFDYPDGDYAKRERIVADHTDYTLGLLHFLANDESVPEKLRAEMQQFGLHREEFADNGNWPYQIYVREARRMRGAVVVTQRDVTDDRRKPDSIAMGSHFVDSHHVQRLAVSPTEFVNEGRIWLDGWAYQIPYRAITPKPEECANLLVPGAASYTHVAYCTLRLESTWMMVGHAAGVAAARAAKSGKTVQDLIIANLQERLRAQGQVIDFLPDQPEKFVHPKKMNAMPIPTHSRRRFLAQSATALTGAALLPALFAAEKPKRILLRSSWQTVNIGDIAHTPGVLAILEKHLPEAEVRLWPSSVDNGVEEILRARFPKLIILKDTEAKKAAFAECDFMLHGSGPSLVGEKELARWAKETGKPYGVFGITFSVTGSASTKPTPDGTISESVALLSGAKFVYFRDSVSLELAKKRGCTSPVMEFGPDGAFATDLRDDAKAEAFLKANGLEDGKFLCCIPRLRYTPYWTIPRKHAAPDAVKHARNEAMKEHDCKPLRDAITAVVKQTDLKILLCPEDETQMAVNKEMLFDKLPADIRARCVWRENYWLTGEALSTYRRCAGLFGHEMHSPIMCIGNGIPAIVCRWAEQTSKGIMWRDIGLGDWLFDLDQESDVARVADAVLAMAKDPAAAKAKAAKAREFVQQRQQAMAMKLRESLA